jgi:hypothetical protein
LGESTTNFLALNGLSKNSYIKIAKVAIAYLVVAFVLGIEMRWLHVMPRIPILINKVPIVRLALYDFISA